MAEYQRAPNPRSKYPALSQPSNRISKIETTPPGNLVSIQLQESRPSPYDPTTCPSLNAPALPVPASSVWALKPNIRWIMDVRGSALCLSPDAETSPGWPSSVPYARAEGWSGSMSLRQDQCDRV